MKKVLMLLVSFLTIVGGSACSNDNIMPEPDNDNEVNEGTGSAYFGGKKVLVTYFSWGGTTQRMAQQIQDITGADMFRIEPVKPYPTEYTPCTEVAREEKENNARPAIKGTVENWDDYDVVFIGCPVWWWTTPMIIHTFCESYDFKGKTVVPFCTYASTYRDETLAEIVSSTPDAAHLTGEGLTSGRITPSAIQTWIDLINEEWNNQNSSGSDTPMTGTVNLWERGNIPTVTHNVNNSDGPDFIPNMEVFTVADDVTPKGAVIICPGGAFQFRSMQNEGYDVADMLVPMGYQCFIVNYRIAPYTMRESATDLQRAIRYVRAHAENYRINPENIALVGFSAGGILNGEVLLNWRDLTNGTALDNSYRPDALDEVPVSACAVGMIYSFYGRLSVSMNNVETLRAANLPPAFYCWGTRDGFAGQFTQNSNAVLEAGCEVETLILDGYPHGYGAASSPAVWGNRFDAFLTRIMSSTPTGQVDFNHKVTQSAPGGNTSDGGPQAVSNITSVAGVPLVRLNNGVLMPRFGFGTQIQSLEGAGQRQQLNETVRGTVIAALQSGYRHIDDAMFYYNERGAGWGIKESGVPREEIWLTSKISGNLADAQNAFNGMLERLQVDYIDLVYIHHPAGTLADILACWRVMEKEYKAGRIRALGISNFDNRMEAFNYIMQNAEIKPQVAQIECHPLAQRTSARQLYADNYDIQVECWYPLNHNSGDVNDATLRQIAQAHGKTVYQVILRWHMQEGLCPVPGSTNPAHILENIGIFDFELSDTEMAAIRGIDRGDAGRSFNISYGNWNFGNFQDYTYDHTYTPSAIENVEAEIANGESRIYTLDGRLVNTLQKGVNIIRMSNGETKKLIVK